MLSGVYNYGVLVEVEPGVHRPTMACTAEDLTRAHALEVRKAALYAQIELLVAAAAKHDLSIPPELRERASGCRGDLRLSEEVRAELEDCLLAPV
jgi:hypothetical protein